MTDISKLAYLIGLTGTPIPSAIAMLGVINVAAAAALKAKAAAPEIIVKNSSASNFEKLLKFLAMLDAIYEEGIIEPDIKKLGKVPFSVKILCEKLEISQSTCWRLMQHPATQTIFKVERGKGFSYLVRVAAPKDSSANHKQN